MKEPLLRLRVLSALAVVAGNLAAVWLVAAAPPLREALVLVEPAAAGLAFATAALGAVLALLARRTGAGREQHRREAALGRLLLRWGWAPLTLAALAPVWGQWALRPADESAAFAALAGHLPWGDALGHFEGGARLLGVGAFGPFSERRPLYAPLLAVALAAGGYRFALVAQAVLAASATFLFARAVGLRYGVFAALATAAVLHGFLRGSNPTVTTEPLGIALACFGLAILVLRATPQSLRALALGLFGLTLALVARPGPQFLAPALALFAVFAFAAPARRRAAAVALGIFLLTALTTRVLNGAYGSGQASFTTYPAYTLYGLTHGGNYRRVYKDFGEDLKPYGSEQDLARMLYDRSFQALREQPGVFLGSLFNNEVKFFGKLPPNLTRVVSLWPLRSSEPLRERPPVQEADGYHRGGLPLVVLAGAGFVAALWGARRDERWWWAAAAAGLLASVPFVYGDAGFRGLAAAYPIFALGLALGFGRRRPLLGTVRTGAVRLQDIAGASVVGLALLALLGPPLARRAWPRPEPAALAGLSPGLQMVVRLEGMPAVMMAPFQRAAFADLPWIEKPTLKQLLTVAEYGGPDLTQVDTPVVLACVFDFVSRKQYLLAGPLDLWRLRGQFLRVEVAPLAGDDQVFVARAVAPLGGP